MRRITGGHSTWVTESTYTDKKTKTISGRRVGVKRDSNFPKMPESRLWCDKESRNVLVCNPRIPEDSEMLNYKLPDYEEFRFLDLPGETDLAAIPKKNSRPPLWATE